MSIKIYAGFDFVTGVPDSGLARFIAGLGGLEGYLLLVQLARNRRPREPFCGIAYRGLYLFWLGRNPLRQRGSQSTAEPNPGRAAILAVIILTVLYVFVITGLQGVLSPARLQAQPTTALASAAQAIGGPGWARVMAFALALSVVAATGTSI